MNKKVPIGLLGGTFDPVHNKHLDIATQAIQQLQLQTVQFIPCHIPPHAKKPVASTADRLTMLKLATEDAAQFEVNPIEIERSGPSYTIDTLKKLSSPQKVLYFILGSDAFLKLDQWYQWQTLIQHCHLIIADRPHYEISQSSPELGNFYQQHLTKELKQLKQKTTGCIYHLNVEPDTLSSTVVRQSQKENQNVPQKIRRYIKEKQLYK